MLLSEGNYYSQEANRHYMSVSQYKDFLKCEAAALAKLNNEYQESKSDAFLIGSYVGAAIEGEKHLEIFKTNHPEIISSQGKTKGELKSEYKNANRMIEVLNNDPLCNKMLQGDKEVIIVEELFGVPWKIKIDVYNSSEGRIVDLKTVKGIHERYWLNGKVASFVENFGYVTQMAVYTEVERINNNRFERLEPFIVAVSKEETPDIAVICFDEQSIQGELEKIEQHLPRIIAIKEEIESPVRCEKCRYCKQSKRVTRLIHYLELID